MTLPTCHVDYPHINGWDHGPNAQADGGHIAECKGCHGWIGGGANCRDFGCHTSIAPF